MKMFTKKEILPIALIVFAVLISLLSYSDLPELVPSHWNAQGQVDGWSSRDFTVFFFPGLAIGIYVLMILLPFIDPLRRNYPKFAWPYFWFRTVLVLFFVFSVLDLIAVAKENKKLEYITKPLLMPLLALYFIFGTLTNTIDWLIVIAK